jgi:glycosyltransferase involved in cell wall biosynthesis
MPITFYHKEEIPKEYEGITMFKRYTTDVNLTREDNALLLPDLYYLEDKSTFSFFEKMRIRNKMSSLLRDANKVLVFSAYQKELIGAQLPYVKDKLEVIDPGVDVTLRPFDDDAKDNVRYQFADGCAYFISVGPLHPSAELINLLKGFSQFKKRIGSNMKLVLCSRHDKFSIPFLESLDTYKYRNDVIMVDNYNDYERESLIASSYAMVHTNRWDRFGLPIQTAMKLGTAVLVPESSSHAEFAGMAGMLLNEKDPQDIGEKLVRIYKDEHMRSEMIGTGLMKVE